MTSFSIYKLKKAGKTSSNEDLHKAAVDLLPNINKTFVLSDV